MKSPWNWIKLIFVFLPLTVTSQPVTKAITPAELRSLFLSPPESAKPWVFWYWNQGNISSAGITADLQAMKQSGIGGAYLMTIKDTSAATAIVPPIRQLTPEWWQMIRFAITEAKRLGLKLGMHVSDGFALAGGPWITPELSMQKVVWSNQDVKGGQQINVRLTQPETNEGYYKDIAVFAYPSPVGSGMDTRSVQPVITSSQGDSIAKLLIQPGNKRTFGCDEACWIQYAFAEPFTCRSVIIRSRNNFQSNRIIIEASNDGYTFKRVTQLEPPRTGWQDWDADYTHSIPAITAKYFRFSFDKTGTEPGAEDIDAAKWKPSFRLTGLELSSQARIHQYEGKSGKVWRVSRASTSTEIPDSVCIDPLQIINVTKYMNANGELNWNAPEGNWAILRMGHTSTGHKNATGGGGKGLECDKFNTTAIRLQFDNWFGKVFEKIPEASSVVKVFHVDSWECGSQNWSPAFRQAFIKQCGYDPIINLPVMAGIPVFSAERSENFLYDIRQTIATLISDTFYTTLAQLAHKKGCLFTAESVAPTMLSDGISHYRNVDVPMGEFWLRSPTHDKPNDMLDAISGAHIYNKNIVQAEAFTELRTMWDEHPGMLKPLLDRNFALGINKMVYHVFMHEPLLDRKPGMTLDGIGLFFQRNQSWWKPGKAWVDYASRCQALLQFGKPVVDVAVFTGEELPSRSVLPDRLVNYLPGIFGKDKVAAEKNRLLNEGQLMKQSPPGVNHSANMAYPEDWIDPLRGYKYDCFGPDALMRTDLKYKLLVIPGATKMNPEPRLSPWLMVRLNQLIRKGAKVIADGAYNFNGKFIKTPYTETSFDKLGIERDLYELDNKSIAWTHRSAPGIDIYFISNQADEFKFLDLSFRVSGRVPEIWNPVNGEILNARDWEMRNGRTRVSIYLEGFESRFIVFRKTTNAKNSMSNAPKVELKMQEYLELPFQWLVTFDPKLGGPATPQKFSSLMDWSKHTDSSIRYYSGTADYESTFNWQQRIGKGSIWLNLGKVANIAEVIVNGINCGIAWTEPYKVDISKALRSGKNRIIIKVTNTWANRIKGDQSLPEEKRITKTNAPYRLAARPLLEAGLLGPVKVEL